MSYPDLMCYRDTGKVFGVGRQTIADLVEKFGLTPKIVGRAKMLDRADRHVIGRRLRRVRQITAA